jgi:hypothetical protein
MKVERIECEASSRDWPEGGGVFAYHAIDCFGVHVAALFPALAIVARRVSSCYRT